MPEMINRVGCGGILNFCEALRNRHAALGGGEWEAKQTWLPMTVNRDKLCMWKNKSNVEEFSSLDFSPIDTHNVWA